MASFVFLIILQITAISCSKILGYFPVASISHQIVYRGLMLELAKRGHELTVITPDPIGETNLMKNYREINVRNVSYELMARTFDFTREKVGFQITELTEFRFFKHSNNLCDVQFSEEEVKKIVQRDEKFDLVFVEFLAFPCGYYFSYRFNAPLIGISSLGLYPHGYDVIGNSLNPATDSMLFLPYFGERTLFEKIRGLIFLIWDRLLYRHYVLPKQDSIVKKHFGDDVPYIGDLEKNISLIMTNTHHSIFYPRATVPGLIEIGGGNALHFPKVKKLPKDIQEFLDDAKEGVIYFSLGSNVKSSTMPESKRAVFLEAFKQIKQKVLWKWETDDLPGKPDNVKLGKWLPQTDILAHPNIKLFITQGGLQSMGEATHNEIPMIVIPFFADQELNAKKLVSVGVAIRMDFETMTTEELVTSINEVTNNKEYKKNMEKYSALTKDQPQSPMERAVWWTEYVLRHNGARHLRSAAVDMPWYQYFLLDVIAFLLTVALIVLYLIYFIVRTFVRLIFGKSKKTKKD